MDEYVNIWRRPASCPSYFLKYVSCRGESLGCYCSLGKRTVQRFSHFSQECIYSSLYSGYRPTPWEPWSKVHMDTEVSLPHSVLEHSIDLRMHKKHRSRQHNILGPVMGMTFINSRIIQPFPHLWFLTRPLSGLIFLLWVFAIHWYLSGF